MEGADESCFREDWDGGAAHMRVRKRGVPVRLRAEVGVVLGDDGGGGGSDGEALGGGQLRRLTRRPVPRRKDDPPLHRPKGMMMEN